jgi:hypothetical protein
MQRQSRYFSIRVLFVVLFLMAQVSSGWALQLTTSQTVPAWVAWRAFHDSLTFYNKRSATEVNKMLNAQFGLTSAQAAAFLNAGQTYVADIQRIDADTRTEVMRRYTHVLAGNRPPSSGARTPPTGPEKSILQRAIEDGLYAQMEAKNQAALDSHLKTLKGALTAAQIVRIGNFVQTVVAPKISVDTSGAGNAKPGLPPGIVRNTPTVGK